MKTTEYRAETFSPFDLRGTEEHLSAMAAQGWRLESIGRFLWKYRRAQPAAVRYAAACPPAAGEDGDLRDQLYFQELCAAAGWEKVTDWASLQIYASEAPAPVPLETDEALRLEVVHQSMRRTYLKTCRNSLIISLLLLALWLSNLWARPHAFLISGVALWTFAACLLMTLLNVFSIAGYFSWYRRSRRSVEEGGVLAAVPRYYRIVNRLPAVLLVLTCLILVPLVFMARDAESGLSLAAAVTGSALGVGLGWAVKRLSDKRGWDGYTRAAAVILSLLALLAVLSGLAGALDLPERIRLSGPEVPSYTWNGREWDQEPQPLPLTLADLTGEDWPHVRRTARTEGRTPFASETVYTETAAREDGAGADLLYTVTDVPNERLCRAVLDDIRTGPSFLEYQSEDPAPWGAEAVYRLCYSDGRQTGEWLILWPGRIAAFRTEGLNLSPEQKALAGERLAPEGWKEDTP